MNIQDECRALLAKPLEEISEDIFFRADNFREEPWYGDFQLFLAIGVCQPSEEHVLQVRKALKVMGFDTRTAIRDGKTCIVPDEPRQSPAEAGSENRAE